MVLHAHLLIWAEIGCLVELGFSSREDIGSVGSGPFQIGDLDDHKILQGSLLTAI